MKSFIHTFMKRGMPNAEGFLRKLVNSDYNFKRVMGLKFGTVTSVHRLSSTMCLTGRQHFYLRAAYLSSEQIDSANNNSRVVDYKLTDIGEGIKEVELLQWFVKVGDEVSQFDPICSVQSDKATVDITSRYDGKVLKLKWDVGQMAKVGETLIQIETKSNSPVAGIVDKQLADKNNSSSFSIVDPNKKVEAKTPEDIESKEKLDRQVRLSLGERRYSMEPTLTPVAPNSASSAQNLHDSIVAQPLVENSNEIHTHVDMDGKVLATPAVRRLVKEHNLSLESIPGSGKDGRVLKEDVLSVIHGSVKPKPTMSKTQLGGTKTETASTNGATSAIDLLDQNTSLPRRLMEDKPIELKGVQKIMHASMTKSLEIPHFNYMDEFIMDELAAFREEINNIRAASKLGKMSYMPIFIKMLSSCLHDFPGVNAHHFTQNSKITLLHKKAHNIGIAMDTPRGLIVPIIRNCENLNIEEVAESLQSLQQKAIANKLTEADLSGATFTISNIGTIGGTYMSPVIVPPQVSIVAFGKIGSKVVFENEKIKNIQVMNVSFAGDHRVLDGATLARFSAGFKQLVENPSLLASRLR